ncbi:MAG: beta-galactosidase GalA [Verrucomicrobiia bacterium]
MSISYFNCRGRLLKMNQPKMALAVIAFMILTGAVHAQTLIDLGATAPTPGINDAAQLSASGNVTAPDGLNYYTDNQVGHGAGEPGQTFTTGNNSAGYVLTSMTLKTGGLGSSTYSGIGTAQPYYLHLYSVSGSTATLLQTYTSANFTFSDGDWLKWSGLSVALAANSTYAYSFGKASSITGWEPMAVAANNLYAGGEIGLISPVTGAITLGSSHGFDAVFDAGLISATQPNINQLAVSPTNNVFAGTPVTFAATVSGASPLYFQWQFNNGGGYANLAGANTNTLVLNTALTNTGSYQLVLTNSYGAVTSAPVALTVTAAIISQVTVSPANNVFAGTPVTFAASVSGASPLYLQWQFNNGGGYASLAGANTNTLAFSAAVTNSGSYQLVLTNSYGAVTSTPVTLSVTLDTNPPVALRGFNLGTTNMEVDFSKALDAASATSVVNYVFSNGLAITGASLAANGTTVILTTAPLVYGSNYTLVINGIRDQAVPPNAIAPNTLVNFTASPRGRILLDTGWRFQLGDPVDVTTNVTYYPEIPDLAKLDSTEVTGTSSETYFETNRVDIFATHAGENVSFVQTNYNDSTWRLLNLPHDWVVELPFNAGADTGHGFKPVGNSSFGANNFGWYRRTFTLPASYAGQKLFLEFDGVYRNCLVWLNGHILGRNVSGYEGFYFDATQYANPGGTNVLVVRVDASRFEGWFYEGAGIYRHVWLTTENPVHVAEWGTYVATTSLVGSNATITIQTEVTNQSGVVTASGNLTSTIFDAGNNPVATVTSAVSVPAGQDLVVTQTVSLTANLWSLQTPYLYNLVTTVSNQNAVADIYNTPFGVRTVSIDATNGVFINGQHVWIQGMCNHQDMAGVGSALPDRLQYFRIERLKQMGVNAYRSSHNTPTAELLNACDQLGMLVLDENRRLGTNAEPLGELSRQIRRDRNHPSVFMWSLANEEPLQGTTTGAAIIQVMQNLVHSLDSTRLCTAALNSWGAGFSSVLDVNGFNYQLGQQDTFHTGNPAWPIIGTETSSQITDRGIYTNDTANGYVWGYDLNPVSWGETAEAWWQYYSARPWSSGGFSWTGFDYRGEPTPYGWPCINSHFGTLDMCGFPKDNFYYYQANWTLKPVLHVFPHWNWTTPGQPINVWAFGNCQAVELFTNGVSLGRQALNVQGHVEWDNVAYTAGTLQAIGYNNGVAVITNSVVTTGAPAAIALIPDRRTILADGKDVSVVTVAVLDAQGNLVPTAANEINFSISAGAAVLGVGNGDPSSHEADKASQRAVFNGLAQVIVQSINQPGTITLTAASTGLTPTNIILTEAATLPPPAAPTGVAAVAGNAQVTVSWDIVPGAITYNLWRATTHNGPYTLVAGNIGGVNLGFTDNRVANLTTYYYVVTANGNGTSVNSAEVSATPAAIVTGLTAIAGSGQIILNWNGSPGVSYNVKRSTVTGGPYTTLAASVANTNYTDSSVATCQTYFYVVTVTNAGNESLPSAEAGASLPGGAPPAPWLNQDIGSVGSAGSATYCNGQFTVSGSGADIWGTNDACQFVYVYVPISTNCDIRARVVSVQNTSGNAKAAVMIRETLTAGSRQALADVEPTAGIEFLWRTNTGFNTTSATVAGQTAPNWVRLTRTNNTFRAYWSPDGNAWTQIGAPTNINMAVSAYAGLAVCAHNNTVLNTSVLDNVSASFLAANTAPTLAPIANQTVNVGQTVALNASATDTQTLTFSLLSAPASATLTQLNNTNAAFNWRPKVTDANTTNPVTLKVADPSSLSATQSFWIVVNPLTLPIATSFTLNNGQFGFQVGGQVGPDYAVEVSTDLVNWSTLFMTNPPLMPFSWVDTNAAALPAQFYRIQVGPPLP